MGPRGAARAAGAVAAPPPRSAVSDAVFLGAILAVAAALRAWLPFGHVFTGGYVNFQTHDSWYHVRLVEALARTFPHPLHVDPFAADGGRAVPVGPLFDFSIVVAARLIGLGHPSARTIDIVAAWAPIVYALATIALVYGIGRRVFDSLTGLLAATLLATTPGPFLDRTVLGYVDHHAAEACLSALTLYGLAAAMERRRPALVAGVALGAYLVTWTSGVFLLFILASWAVVQAIVDYLRGRESDRVARALVPAAIVAAIIVALFEDRRVPQHDVRVAGALLTAAVAATLEAARRAASRRARVSPATVLTAIAAAMAIGAVVVAIAAPGLTTTLVANVRRLVPDAAGQTIGEATPILSIDAATSALRAWLAFRTTFFLALPGLVLLARDAWRRRSEARLLLVVWTVVALLATLAQNRFGYYLSVELSLIAAWMSAAVLRWAGVGVAGRSRALGDVAVVAVAAAVFYPGVPAALRSVRFDSGMPPAWERAFAWMRASTPEPFADGDAAYARDARPGERPAYTVMNWWDYGYWLIRTARRVPVANPTQNGAVDAARFFTATDPADADRLLDAVRARYVVVGQELPVRASTAAAVYQSWFLAMPAWAGRDLSRFSETMFQRTPSGSFSRVAVFYPEYYQSMTSRLYLFGGRAIEPRRSTWIVSFIDRQAPTGNFREIVELRPFDDYAAALRQLDAPGAGRRRIVGLDPARSCVPLTAMAELHEVYESPEHASLFPGLPAVRIFERNLRVETDSVRP